MDVVSPLIYLALKSLITLFPMTVVWLAFRRLALSKTDNAWIYAAMCIFAAVTSAGVLPWALGIAQLNWMLVVLALLSPMAWVAIVMVCDVTRKTRYAPDVIAESAIKLAARTARRYAPQLFNTTDRDDEALELEPEQQPIFVHRVAKVVQAARTAAKPATRPDETRSILSLARDIRTNATSDARRPKLLPAPDHSGMALIESPNNR